jgi:1-acyl-sn-glycerol-3-phosphate acyltransferase
MLVRRTLLTYPFLVFGTVFGGLIIIPMVALGERDGRLWWPGIVQRWARVLVRTGGVTRVEIVGDVTRLGEFGGVVMSNHESHFDSPALILSSPVPLRFMAKKSLSRFPIFGRALKAMGMLFVDRANKDQAWASIREAAASVAAGKIVLVFPEGTRAKGDDLLPFKRGGFVLAVEAGAPILPVGVAGAGHVLPPGWAIQGTGPVVVVFGEPIETRGRDDVEALMAETRAAIEHLRAEARRRRDASAEV